MKRNLAHIYQLSTPHYGPALRVYLGLYMLASGTMRIITGSNATPINVFPSRVYGVLFVLAAIGLLITSTRPKRCSWRGRVAAMVCCALWLLIVGDAWGAWVSITGATMNALALGNEVRVYEC